MDIREWSETKESRSGEVSANSVSKKNTKKTIKGASAREKVCTDHGIHGLSEFTMALCSSGPNGAVIGPAKLVKFLRERGRVKKKNVPS